MACLRSQSIEVQKQIDECEEEGCAYRLYPIEVNPEYDGWPSPDDCVIQLRNRSGDARD